MANSKMIIVEGPQGVGKTTVTDYLRDTLKGSNLYRLSGTNDSTVTGKAKAEEMYYALHSYIKNMENKSINLIFDRTFFTEENYCRLGKKEYSFTDVYNKLAKDLFSLDFEIYYINLYLKDEKCFEKRLQREGKAKVAYSKFSIDNSLSQQRVYLEMLNEISAEYPCVKTLNLDTSVSVDEVKNSIRNFVGY